MQAQINLLIKKLIFNAGRKKHHVNLRKSVTKRKKKTFNKKKIEFFITFLISKSKIIF